MEKHAKVYRDIKKTGQLVTSDIKTPVYATVHQYPLKQERDIEEVLSPFWAWRSLSH